MTPQEIATNWIAKDGEIRPVNPYAICDPLELFSAFKIRQFKKDEFDVANEQHTYPCPTLANGEYRGEDLDFVPVFDINGERLGIDIKSEPPAIDAGETVEELHDIAGHYWWDLYRQNPKKLPDFNAGFIAGHTHTLKGYVRVDEVVEVLEKEIAERKVLVKDASYCINRDVKEDKKPFIDTVDYLEALCGELTEIITQIKNLTK